MAEIVAHPSGALNPYGDGNSSNSPIFALGEAWAYHMGHFLADQQYGKNASVTAEQLNADGATIVFEPDGTNRPHIDVLENYDPTISNDPFHWIPKGLMEDLMDDGETFGSPVDDQVSGYTIPQLFAALQSDVFSIPQYEARLLQQNPGNPTNPSISTLFSSYGF